MPRLGKRKPLDPGYLLEKRLDHTVLRFVVEAIEQQRRTLDLVHFVHDRPGLEGAGDVELRGSVPVASSLA